MVTDLKRKRRRNVDFCLLVNRRRSCDEQLGAHVGDRTRTLFSNWYQEIPVVQRRACAQTRWCNCKRGSPAPNLGPFLSSPTRQHNRTQTDVLGFAQRSAFDEESKRGGNRRSGNGPRGLFALVVRQSFTLTLTYYARTDNANGKR